MAAAAFSAFSTGLTAPTPTTTRASRATKVNRSSRMSAGKRAGGMATRALPQAHFSGDSCALTTSVIAPTVAEALEEIKEAVAGGADIVELRIDFIDTLVGLALFVLCKNQNTN
jgi:hypothetical protein